MKNFSCAYKNKNKYKLDRYNVNYCCAIYVILIATIILTMDSYIYVYIEKAKDGNFIYFSQQNNKRCNAIVAIFDLCAVLCDQG